MSAPDLYLPVLHGTVREGRKSIHVARFVEARLRERPGVETRLFDPREWPFGNLVAREWEQDPRPPRVAEFVDEMARADGFVIVTPEYNHGYPGTLKNMLDAVYDEWNRKPFALVGCGGVSGGLRALDALRQVVTGLGAITVPTHVPVQSVGKEFEVGGPHDPEKWTKRFARLFDELEWYARALKAAREAAPPGA
jgi:NAD(P)H-dependent FMN reductase